MRTNKFTAIMLLGAMFFGFFTANAQQQTKKWKYTGGVEVNFDFLSANKGWKPAAGSRPGGFGAGCGLNMGARYDKLFFVFDAEISFADNYSSNSAQCDLLSGLAGIKLGYDFLKFKNAENNWGLTFVTGLLFGTNSLEYNFKSHVDNMTVQEARSLSANYNQIVGYIPLELRCRFGKGYLGVAYMLNVFRDDITSGYNSTAKITDAPNINVLPLRLTYGFQL